VGFCKPAVRFGFRSDVLVSPFDCDSRQFEIGLDAVSQLASDFEYRIRLATSPLEARDSWGVTLTPIPTNFGMPPTLTVGYCLSVRAEAFADLEKEAVSGWKDLVVLMCAAFEQDATLVAKGH
jgi:hypothetical protein